MYDDYISGKIVVALNNNCFYPESPDYYSTQILHGIEYEKTEVIFHPDKLNCNSGIGYIILVYLKNKEKSEVMTAIDKITANPYVVYAEPDYYLNAHIIPNDMYYDKLWGIKRVRSELAWNYTTGSENVVVGVTDSGIDYNHPDINKNMWVSQNNINGWNFAADNSDSMDTNGHGTHVAGTIGAIGNNYIGVAGVNWNVEVASLKLGNGAFSLDAAIASIDFANINKIPILNNSWGGRSYSPSLKYAIQRYEGLFVVSAGNNGTNNDFFPMYPASYDSDNIISVAATTPTDVLASFSNYGIKSVDIAAPGTDIFSLSLHNQYSYLSGTSMASPHVAGAAALLKSYIPSLTTSEVKNIILSSAEKLPSLENRILTGGILNIDSMFKMASELYK